MRHLMGVLALGIWACAPGYAATCTATGNASISSPTNWDCGHAPGAGDTAIAAVAGRVISFDISGAVGSGVGNAVTLTNGAVLSVSPGVTATFQGGISGDAASRVYYSAASTITLSGSASVTLSAPLQPSPSNPPTFSSPAAITGNLNGTNVAAAITSPNLNLTNVMVSNLGAYAGGTQTYGITYSGAGTGNTFSMSQVTFRSVCGVKIAPGWTANDQWSGVNVTFQNTPNGCQSWNTGAIGWVSPGPGRAKQMTNVVFDGPVTIGSRSEKYTNVQFWNGWGESIFVDVMNPYSVDGYSLVRLSWQRGSCTTLSGNNGQVIQGAHLDHVLMIGDSSTCISQNGAAGLAPATSGAVTSATATTLTDSSKAGIWAANQYASNGISVSYFVVITSGAGAGQVQTIEANTGAGQLAPRYPWDTQPDTTSQYAIYRGVANPHWTNGPTLISGQTVEHRYVMAGLWGAADNNGDFWHAMTCPSGATAVPINSGVYTLDNTILFPSLMLDNSGTLLTASNCWYKIRHSTYFTGAQSIGINEGVLSSPGTLLDFSGNLAWAGTRTYRNSGAGSSGAFGPWYLTDENIATSAADSVATTYNGSLSAADYNADFRQRQTGRAAADRPGSNPAYDVKSSVVMGTHDLRNTDPQFPNLSATPQAWAQTLGLDTAVQDPIQILPDLYAKMMGVFNFTGADPRFGTQALWAYLMNAATPRNPALHGADSDGTDIGAAPMSVNASSSTVTWANPSPITYGTLLSSAQLNATSPIPGTFSYSPATGTKLNAGSNTLTVTFTPSVTGYLNATATVTLQVPPATVQVTAQDATRPYGAANPALGYVLTGLVAGDTAAAVSGFPLLSAAAVSGSPVGTYPVTVSSGSLMAANYSFAFVSGTLTVTPAILTVGTQSPSILYGSASPASTPTYSGFANGETTAVLSGAPDIRSSAPAGAGAGSYPVTIAQGTLSAANYTFRFVNGTLTIAKAPLTVTGVAGDYLYGGVPGISNTLSASYAGFVNGETAAVLSGAPVLTTTAQTGSPVGTYSVIPATGTLAAQNYVFQFVAGTFHILPATLTVTAVNGSRPFGAANPPIAVTFTGFAGADDGSVVSNAAGFTTTAVLNSPVGRYTLVPTAGALTARNYTFGAFVAGTLDVTAATPIIKWSTPAAVPSGTILSAVQLNATATLGGGPVPGALTYSPDFGTVMTSGIQTLQVTFTPADQTNYNRVTATVNLAVN